MRTYVEAGARAAPALSLAGQPGFLRGCILLLLLMAGSALAAPKWNVLETPRFTVVSQLSERETRDWAEEFDYFITALNRVIPVNEKMLPRLTMVIFRREKDFRPYTPRKTDGKIKKAAGFFARCETWGVVGMREGVEDFATRETIYHEGVHWMLSVYPKSIPLCMNEGLAEVFSTFKTVRGEAKWGEPVEGCLAHLLRLSGRELSTEELMHTTHAGTNYNEDDRVHVFYAKSWLLVHYLLFGKREGARSALNDFLDAYSKDMPVDEAFQKGIGMSFKKMDDALRAYIRGGKYRPGIMKLEPREKLLGSFTPASQVEVELALAKLASGAGYSDLALKHGQTAIGLAPEKPECWDTLAGLQALDSEEGGYEAAKKAVALGSKDGWSHIILAQEQERLARRAGEFSAAEARAVANLLEDGVERSPYYRRGYRVLARSMADLEQHTNRDVQTLQQGLKLFPEDAVLYLGLAQIALGAGESEAAWKLLTKAQANGDKMDMRDKDLAKDLKRRWILNDATVRLTPMAERGKPMEALELIDGYINDKETGVRLREDLRALREPIEILAKYAKAREAMKAGRRDEARTLLEEVMNCTKAPLRMRTDAYDLLLFFDKQEADQQKRSR